MPHAAGVSQPVDLDRRGIVQEYLVARIRRPAREIHQDVDAIGADGRRAAASSLSRDIAEPIPEALRKRVRIGESASCAYEYAYVSTRPRRAAPARPRPRD